MLRATLLRGTTSFAKPYVHQAVHRARPISAMAPSKIIHWDSKTCPFAQRSWITLIEKDLPFDIKEVDLANKSDEFKAKYATVHPDPTAPAKVPILEDTDGAVLIESLTVAMYLDAKYPEPALLPKDPAAVAKIDLFIEFFAPATFGKAFQLVKADTRDAVAALVPELVEGLKTVNTALERFGSTEGGDYFLGGTYTLADVATSTLFHRAVHVLKGHRDIDIFALIKENNLERLSAWAEAVLSRPSLLETSPSPDAVVSSMAKFVVPLKD